MRTPSDLTKLINQSGFPLQIAIERLVEDPQNGIPWRVLHREYGWRHTDGQTGFIDIALEDNTGASVLIVECKRVLEADWLFLEPQPSLGHTRNVRLWATYAAETRNDYCAYYDAESLPESSESMYCVVAGQDQKSRPMLERIAAEATTSTEALALEERPLALKKRCGLRTYMPVIVTTAKLHLSNFDPGLVSLANGEVASASHSVVPWVRFRKQLSSEFAVPPKNPNWGFSDRALAKEKQVFIVNVESFAEFLRKWKVLLPSIRPLLR